VPTDKEEDIKNIKAFIPLKIRKLVAEGTFYS